MKKLVKVLGALVFVIAVIAVFKTTAQADESIADCDVSLSKYTYTYTGDYIEPSPTVYDWWYDELYEDIDYTVTYSNNYYIGTAKMTIWGWGDYYGSKTITFKIIGKLNYTKKNCYKGKSFKLRLRGGGSGTRFRSSNRRVCTVSSSGRVKAKRKGKATITATYKGRNYKCRVSVLGASKKSSSKTKYYKNNKKVPDFGALLKIKPTSHSGNTYKYSLKDLQNVDPDKKAGGRYRKLLKKCKFKYKGTKWEGGKKYYKYEKKKTSVLFGVASVNGEVKVMIRKK